MASRDMTFADLRAGDVLQVTANSIPMLRNPPEVDRDSGSISYLYDDSTYSFLNKYDLLLVCTMDRDERWNKLMNLANGEILYFYTEATAELSYAQLEVVVRL